MIFEDMETLHWKYLTKFVIKHVGKYGNDTMVCDAVADLVTNQAFQRIVYDIVKHHNKEHGI